MSKWVVLTPAQLKPVDRQALSIPELAASAKEGSWPCKKHSNAGESHWPVQLGDPPLLTCGRVFPVLQLEEAVEQVA